MSFGLSKRSQNNLSRISVTAAQVARRAIFTTEVDFGVICGIRDNREQLDIYRNNKSQLNGIQKGVKVGNIVGTGISMHQLKLAFDVAAFLGKDVTWEVRYYLPIAMAMRDACIEQNVEMIWGGCWDKPLTKLKDIRLEMNRYVRRKKAMGQKPFIDAGHFQMERRYVR